MREECRERVCVALRVPGVPLTELVERDDAEPGRERREVQAPGVERVQRPEPAAVHEQERLAVAVVVDPRGDAVDVDGAQPLLVEAILHDEPDHTKVRHRAIYSAGPPGRSESVTLETSTSRAVTNRPAEAGGERSRPSLRDFWHPVATSEAVGTVPLGVRLLEQDVVVFRDEGGTVHAWRDICVHRGTKLSLGRVANGRLVCAYHGWEYACETGSCVHIPSLAEGAPIPARARAERTGRWRSTASCGSRSAIPSSASSRSSPRTARSGGCS